MTARPTPRLEVVRADARHAEPVAEFIRQVWDPRATAATVLTAWGAEAAHNVAEPGVAPPTWIALQEGRVLGYVTTLPIQFWDGDRAWPAYWIKGLMVLPEFRGGPIGYLVLKAAAAGLPRSGGLAVAAPALRLFTGLGYRDYGAIPNWVLPVAPHRVLKRLDLAALGIASVPSWAARALKLAQTTGLATIGGWAGGLAMRSAARVTRWRAVGLRTGVIEPAAQQDALQRLWVTARPGFPSAVVRDPAYLIHRYPGDAGSPYIWLGAWRGDQLEGVAILRRPRAEGDERLRGIRVATLSDLVFPPGASGVGLALLGRAAATARASGADAILASFSSSHLARLLRRQFYVPMSGNVHLLLREIAPEKSALSTELSGWWLTRGDGLADEVF